MPNTEHHAALIIGDLALTVAKLKSENDALAEHVADLKRQLAAAVEGKVSQA